MSEMSINTSSAFEELIEAEKLLNSKGKVSSKAIISGINRVWTQFDHQATVNQKELRHQIKNCTSEHSPWVLRRTPPIDEHYVISSVLGNPGQYGVVKTAVRIKDKEKFAVKILSKNRFKESAVKKSFFEDIRTEVYLLSATADHPHIVECYSVFEDIDSVYLIMSRCNGGELFDRIQTDEGFNEVQASNLFRQMVSAVYYVHRKNVAHCDLKPENFLFRHKGKDSPLCLIDFGMAKIVEWRKYYHRMHGTPYYIAPEVLDGHYNESCDMWSLGVILFIMLFGFPPFFDDKEAVHDRARSDEIVYSKIRQGFTAKVRPNYGNWFPSEHPVSPSARDLISRLLRKNVADRMTAEEALEHPWIKQAMQLDTGRLNRREEFIMNPTIIHSIAQYTRHSNLQSQILDILKECNYLNKAQMKGVKDFFDAADIDGDGRISTQELFDALKTLDSGVTMEETKAIMASVDKDNDGFLNFDELLASRINRKLQSKEERLRKVFRALDLDNSGKISASELKAAAQCIDSAQDIGLDAFAELIKDGDINGDGEIDFEEFISMFHAKQ